MFRVTYPICLLAMGCGGIVPAQQTPGHQNSGQEDAATKHHSSDAPAGEVPELKVLSRYVGTWDYTYRSEDPPLSGGVFHTRWILDGRFAEQIAELKASRVPKSVQLKTLMTYDQDAKVYRKWTFLSNGRVLTGEGTWDEGKRTMTWRTTHDGGDGTLFTTVDLFPQDGVMTWKTNAKRPGEHSGSEQFGKSLRRDE